MEEGDKGRAHKNRKLVLILGAGFSYAATSKKMPLLQGMTWDSVMKEFGPIRNPSTFEDHIYQYIEKEVPKKIKENVERLSAFLAIPHPWLGFREAALRKAAYFHVIDMYGRYLETEQGRYFSERKSISNAFKEFLKTCLQHTEDIEIFTFNQDLIIETEIVRVFCRDDSDKKVFNEWIDILRWSNKKDDEFAKNYRLVASLTLRQFYRHALTLANNDADLEGQIIQKTFQISNHGSGQAPRLLFPIFKLHGSLNWFIYPNQHQPGQKVYYTMEGDSVRQDKNQYPLGDTVEDAVRFIIPPILDKGSLYSNSTLVEQWKKLRNSCRNAKKIISFGYSMPETDLSTQFLLQEAFKDRSDKEVMTFFQVKNCEEYQLKSKLFKDLGINDHVKIKPLENTDENTVEELTAEIQSFFAVKAWAAK